MISHSFEYILTIVHDADFGCIIVCVILKLYLSQMK
jgi:hypothetical protein